VDQFHIYFLAALLCEALRRTVWATIRVENEMINNFEGYRVFTAIPKLEEDSMLGLDMDLDQRKRKDKKQNTDKT
jgi:hypothetical protein